MKKIRFNIIDFIKTAIIFILTFSMLSIAGIYMSERQNAGQLSEVPLEKRRVIENGGIPPSAIKINPNHINPLKIVITSDSKSVAAVYDSKLVSDIYRDFRDFVLALFSGRAKCEIIDDADKAEEFWNFCLENPESVYIKYAGDYVYPLIYDFLVQDETGEIYESAESRVIAKVRELFIIPYDYSYTNANFIGAAKDSNGNISIFYPAAYSAYFENLETDEDYDEKIYADLIDINSVDFAAYNDIAGIVPCRFLKNSAIEQAMGFNKNNIENLKLPGDFLLFDNFTYSSVLSYINPVFDEYDEIDARRGEKIRELLRVFNFSIESSGLLSVEENGKSGKKFIENHDSLTVFEDGKIFYSHTSVSAGSTGNTNTANNINGIHLSKFLGFDSNYYTFHEKIKAASIFINTLSSEIAGHDGDLHLSEIKFEQNNLIIVFSYYYKGIKINSDNHDTGVRIVISQNTIIEAGIDALHINSEKTARNLKQVTALSFFERELVNAKNTEFTNIEEDEDYTEDYIHILTDFDIEDGDLSIFEMEDNTKEKLIIKTFELIYNINAADRNNIIASWKIQ